MNYERRQNVGHKTAFVLFYRANLQASKWVNYCNSDKDHWGQTKHCRDKKVQQSGFMVYNALTKTEYQYSFSQTSLDD